MAELCNSDGATQVFRQDVVLEWLGDRGEHRSTLWGAIFSLHERQDLVNAAAWFTRELNKYADWLVAKGYADPRGVIEDEAAEEVQDSGSRIVMAGTTHDGRIDFHYPEQTKAVRSMQADN